MIDYEPDAEDVAIANLAFFEELNGILAGLHCPRALQISFDGISYNHDVLYVLDSIDEETEPIEIEGEE